VNVQDLGGASAAHVGHAVVQVALTLLVESDHGVDRRPLVRRRDPGGQLRGAQRHLAHAALHEVSGECGLGKLHHVRARLECSRLREHLAHPAKVALNVRLSRAELGYGDVQKRHRPKVRTVDR
jgi:hypothetical protein